MLNQMTFTFMLVCEMMSTSLNVLATLLHIQMFYQRLLRRGTVWKHQSRVSS